MSETHIYLDTNLLQKDLRIRLPKTVLSNMNVEKGKTKFDIYLDANNNSLIFRVHVDESVDFHSNKK